MKFNCITRPNHSPQGLSKVYFCAHPKDHAKYLEEFSKEILTLHNCAVWYDEEPEKDYSTGELLSALETMNLFVVPITHALLTMESRALDVEIEFAQKNNIPILPIMKEDDLEELFCHRFGSIQFLMEDYKYESEIPYRKKLENYLSSIIIGDELAQRIRNAFDAYIFLSYRKKDRKQALELMHLIHRNDFTRDIAIWYDEYLVPGENFNDSIRQAFEKSSLFVLNVTPSILEEIIGSDGIPQDNYVKHTEYPMAITAKKIILPAETVETDKAKLKIKFPLLPPCIKISNKEMLNAALTKAFNTHKLRQNDNDPEHCYLIGLAYLNGIDVEINKSLGLELIHKSADAGYIDAIRKLISVYEEGDGVERNYETAASWRERLVSGCEAIYRASNVERDGSEWFWEIIYLSDALGALGRTKDQIEYAKYAIKVANEQFEAHKTRNASRNLFVGYERLGNSIKAQGNISDAKLCYIKGLEIAQYISDADRTIEAVRDLSLMYNGLGDIARSEGNLDAARDYYLKALALREEIAKASNTYLTVRDIPTCCDKLGDIEAASGNPSKAREYYLKGLEILENAPDNVSGISKRDLSVCFGKLGDVYASEAQYNIATEYYEKSLDLAKELSDRKGTAEAKHDLIAAIIRLAFVALEGGRPNTAKEYYTNATEYARDALAISDSLTAKRDLWLCYVGLADILKRTGNLDLATKSCSDALCLADEMYKSTKTAAAERDYIKSVSTYGDIALAGGDIGTATDHYLKCLEIIDARPISQINVKDMRDALLSHVKLGNIDKARGDLTSARDRYLKALDIAQDILDGEYSVKVDNDFSIITSSLGEIMQAWGDTDAARDYFTQSLIAAASVVHHCMTPNALDALGVAYYKASFYDDAETRKTYLGNALEIYEKLTKEHPQNDRFSKNLGLVKKQLEQ